MNKFKIGWSEVSIVPEGRKLDLVGQFYERISSEVETPIAVTGMAMESGDDCFVFVACDLTSTSYNLLEEIRARLPEDFPKDKLIISAIHSHTTMGYARRSDMFSLTLNNLDEFKPEGVEYESLVHYDSPDIIRGEEAREYLIERIAEAALEAWNNRADAAYAFGFGRAAVGMCRRACYDDGSAKMWGDTTLANFTELESGNDSGIEMMFTYDADKKLTGVVANVACPAQVLEHNSFISSDYMGKVRELIQEKYGKDVCFLGLVSPAGDMCPRDLIRWVDAEFQLNDPNITHEKDIPHRADPSMFDIKGANLAAKRVANEIFWQLDDVTEYVTETELVHKTIKMDLPLRRVTIKEKDDAVAAIKGFFANHKGNINYVDNARMQIHSGTIARYNLQQNMDVFEIEVHVMRVGDVAFATNPFELFLNYGNQIRSRSLAKQTFLIQLCCGSYGYLPTEKAEKGSHYSAFVSSGTTGHVGGEMLVRKTLSEINSLWEK